MSKVLAVLIAAALAASASVASAQAPAGTGPSDAKASKAERTKKGVAQEKAYEDASRASSTAGAGAKTDVDKSQPKRTAQQKRSDARALEKQYGQQGEGSGSTGSPKVDKSTPKALPDKASKQQAAQDAARNKDNRP